MERLRFVFLILALSFTFACAKKPSNLESSLRLSNTIYSDLAPQITNALETSAAETTKTKRLHTINQSLESYTKAYSELVAAVNEWKTTGVAPSNINDLYNEMWGSLINAATLAATIYIYASECTQRTTLKGKACP